MFVGAYWKQRKESREEVAARLVRFLSAAAGQGSLFSKWYLKGRTPSGARTPLSMDSTSIAKHLRVNRRDVGGQEMTELGYRLAVWNGNGVSLEATLGVTSPYVRNSVVLSFEKGQDRLSKKDCRTLIEAAVQAFDPEHAVITTAESLERSHATNPWEAGSFTYERGSEIREHQPDT
jgi:hypothetical protein